MQAKKRKRCKVCNELFMPGFSTIQPTCSVKCAIEYQCSKEGKDYVSREKKRFAQKRKKEFKQNDLSFCKKKAQESFNRYIRIRDRNLPCVTCDVLSRGIWNAGHFHPAGRASALRFDESNVHKQCVPCNQHNSGRLGQYRINIVARIGQQELERLDAQQNDIKRWSVEELKKMRKEYDKKAKELLK